MSPPSTACANTPATRPSESQVRSRRRGVRTRLPSTATITAIDTSPVNIRLSDSIHWCESDAAWAVSWPESQFGHDGHPSPDDVSRTAAPVTMMTASRIAATSVICRYAAGLNRGTRMAPRS